MSTAINLDDMNKESYTKIDPVYRTNDKLASEFERWFFTVKYKTHEDLKAFFGNPLNTAAFRVVLDSNGQDLTGEVKMPPYFTLKQQTEYNPSCNPGSASFNSKLIVNSGYKDKLVSQVDGFVIPKTSIQIQSVMNGGHPEGTKTMLISKRFNGWDRNTGVNKFIPFFIYEAPPVSCTGYGGRCPCDMRTMKVIVKGYDGPHNKYWKLVPIVDKFSDNVLNDFLNSEIGSPFKYICCTYVGNRGIENKIRTVCNLVSLYSGSQKCDVYMNDYCIKPINNYDISCGCIPEFLPNKNTIQPTNDKERAQLEVYKKFTSGNDLYKKYSSNPLTKIPRRCIVGTCKVEHAYKFEDREINCPDICESIINVNTANYATVDLNNISQNTNCAVASMNSNITSDQVIGTPTPTPTPAYGSTTGAVVSSSGSQTTSTISSSIGKGSTISNNKNVDEIPDDENEDDDNDENEDDNKLMWIGIGIGGFFALILLIGLGYSLYKFFFR